MTTQAIEIRLLLDAMNMAYGHDFSGYSLDMLTRRILDALSKSQCTTVAQMIPRVLNDPEFFSSLVYNISIPITKMFRDPSFYGGLRRDVIPELKKQSHVSVWHAGCASGEEVYSLAILLKEEGLYDRCRIYATDINDIALKKARDGVYRACDMVKHTQNYQKAGGAEAFSDYYHAKYDWAKMDESLGKNVTFANHNLATDGVFGEMDLILCRNVFIYFNRELQDNVLSLFRDSLSPGGFLCLGKSESLKFSTVQEAFQEVSEHERIYQECQAQVCGT